MFLETHSEQNIIINAFCLSKKWDEELTHNDVIIWNAPQKVDRSFYLTIQVSFWKFSGLAVIT